MVFSSSVFLFVFLPVLFFIYYSIPQKYVGTQNAILFIFSIAFYAYGEPKFVIIMIISIIINYFTGNFIAFSKSKRRKNLFFVLGLAFNIFLLFIFKYLTFTVNNLNFLLNLLHLEDFQHRIPAIALPIGISFFTFQSISYLADVYKNEVKPQKNILYLGLYISFFPQLIAGPIVRYIDIENQLLCRKQTLQNFDNGVKRFITGLAKKVILANNLGIIVNEAFSSTPSSSLSLCMAWLGAIAFSLQIYFDFSGYSDMAIGLGKMFGFDFKENFNYPYLCSSTRDFWRRWHISLGTWFRDYVYYPLGGSYVESKHRLVFNLFVVWILTGIWHGASWNFILWGLMYFFSISIEHIFHIPDNLSKTARGLYRIFTIFYIIIGWVVFRSSSLTESVHYIMAMFGIGIEKIISPPFIRLISENLVFLIAAIIFSVPIAKFLFKRMTAFNSVFASILECFIYFILLLISTSAIILNGYNPFLYFNF